ncbi:hypothetical protein TorRG33x02_047890 [Trema orientale]|uniref:Transmembrane protein n=1 Tax=Trema orientale TaxID=63057 RepID=A0A2P5FP87_TREOI|nr:hypothetical protein TorRG33x02_047890 [Trema orientale]
MEQRAIQGGRRGADRAPRRRRRVSYFSIFLKYATLLALVAYCFFSIDLSFIKIFLLGCYLYHLFRWCSATALLFLRDKPLFQIVRASLPDDLDFWCCFAEAFFLVFVITYIPTVVLVAFVLLCFVLGLLVIVFVVRPEDLSLWWLFLLLWFRR